MEEQGPVFIETTKENLLLADEQTRKALRCPTEITLSTVIIVLAVILGVIVFALIFAENKSIRNALIIFLSVFALFPLSSLIKMIWKKTTKIII